MKIYRVEVRAEVTVVVGAANEAAAKENARTEVNWKLDNEPISIENTEPLGVEEIRAAK